MLAASAAEGVNLAVFPLTLTVPATAAPAPALNTVKLVVFTVELVNGSEKVAETETLVATPFAAFAGDVEETDGGVISAIASVVKVHVKLADNGLPAASVAPVVMVAVY